MHDFKYCKCLRPFCKVAHTSIYVFEANEGDQEEHAAENGNPEDDADEIVSYKILSLLPASRSSAGVHWAAGRVMRGVEEKGFRIPRLRFQIHENMV